MVPDDGELDVRARELVQVVREHGERDVRDGFDDLGVGDPGRVRLPWNGGFLGSFDPPQRLHWVG
jgi:hypothetical protein